MLSSLSKLASLLTLWLLPMFAAGEDFTDTCANYYVGNGIADGTPGELYIEAWCHGGTTETGQERPSLCTRLDLASCYKNVDGDLKPWIEWEEPDEDLLSTCATDSCAMRGDAWDGPVMSCYCQDTAGIWDLTEVNLNRQLSNEGGFLSCGKVVGTKRCKYPWTTEDGKEEPELR